MSTVNVALHPPYEARIEPGCLAALGMVARGLLHPGGRVVLISAEPIYRHWGAAAETSLAAAGVPYQAMLLPDGEIHKTLADLEVLANAMVGAGCDRHTLVVALGGGVVGDVAAFLASIYMRGVDQIQVPTSLLAMVDSSLGGKTGVNLASGKNLLGTFHHPRLILVDPALLATLPAREYRSGLAEAIKYGVIRDANLFALMESQAAALAQRQAAALSAVITASLRHKAEVVAADEREAGLRRILNFGHTLGHALESATNYEGFLHGEAVAWGMIAAGRIAESLGMFPADEARRMERAILALTRPLPPINASPTLVLRHAANDKKAQAGVLHFVLPAAIGRVTVVSDVPLAVIRAALNATIALSRSRAQAEGT